jgi:hypothetical protein
MFQFANSNKLPEGKMSNPLGPVSLENRFSTRPSGVVSKKAIGKRSMVPSSLRWKLRAAFSAVSRNKALVMKMPRNASLYGGIPWGNRLGSYGENNMK